MDTLSSARERWLSTSMTDARIFQLGFTALYLLDLGLRFAFGARWPWLSWPMASLLLIAVLAAVTPFLRPDRSVHAPVGLAVLDLAAVGMARLDPDPSSGLLIVMPALWLGRVAGRRGVLISVGAVVLLVSIPSMLYSGLEPVETARAVLYPVVAGAAALVMAESMEWIAHQRRVSEAIFDTVDVGLLLLDARGGYAGMNRRHQELMEVGFPDGHAGRAGQVGEAYDADGRTRLAPEQSPSHRASQGEEFDDLRIWIGRDAEARRALSVSARAVRTESGACAGAALSYTDITDLMRALQVKNEFIALVSHELRTPLTSIVGYAQLLEDDPGLSGTARKQLAAIERNAERLRRLVGDLLDVAQHDAGAVGFDRDRIDLVEIVRDAVDARTSVAEGSGVVISLAVAERVVIVGDGQRIAQVVDNLVSNAVKYTLSGGAVQVRLAAEGGHAVLEVSDTGLGIDPGDVEHLFDRFFRSREAESRAIAGAGLGLSIAKDIVEGHGGRIEVESEPGRGSVFRVRLPVGT
ncbi:cell wall metabolism sensor histidine kinase WalK [Nocardioides sp. SR21]|uniref:sensor histidine kinase n=1 Tax=Nocardioides sp. SR21 TaxID=2919501 RepID=UPI001FA9E758|nr:ATP-binding protein [Nocardioides sp. SR21]